MKNIFCRREGQIAPFMIAIIVVLIMALMVTVNIGKVGITKTHTANAADAGALAGSTMHANTLNSLADTNTAMIAEYLGTQVVFLVPIGICFAWARYIAYLAFVAAQTTQYILAWVNADKGYKEAENAAKQYAFMNAGIDESKERLSGESYEAYLERESRFGQWMNDKGYESGQYAWTNKTAKQNSFTVNVDAPGFPGLVPMPMVLMGLHFDWAVECTNLGDCAICEGQQVAYKACHEGPWIKLPGEILLTPNSELSSCPSVAWNVIVYAVPIAWIAAIAEDNPRLTVATTRVEPNSDLGVWEMKYGAISSAANSESKGGSVGPLPNPSYESYLISGGY